MYALSTKLSMEYSVFVDQVFEKTCNILSNFFTFFYILTGFIRNNSTHFCECPALEEPRNEECICLHSSGLIRDADGHCSCPENSALIDLKCQCLQGFVTNTEVTSCHCPENEISVNSTCICKPTFVRNSTSNICECPLHEHQVGKECVCDAGNKIESLKDYLKKNITFFC